MKTALITGIAGQDGSYLAEYLLELGYSVHGILRLEPKCYKNLINLWGKAVFHYADLRDELSLETVIRRVHPDEIYNLAGQTFVPTSWTQPAETFDVNVGGLARILKICERVCPEVRVYQASTSEMYGNRTESGFLVPLDENASMHPVSPYGVAKHAAHKLIEAYRLRGMFAVSGILFNHESPRRGYEMVTMKIVRHVARWMIGDWAVLKLGAADSQRDWGFAGDYAKAMYAMLQDRMATDYVIGSGEAHSVRDFVDAAIRAANLYNIPDGVIQYNVKEFTRSSELHCLVADYRKAAHKLQWKPTISFETLVKLMVDSEYAKLVKNKVGATV